MLSGVATRLPWAIILCRFKGQAADPARENPIEQLYRGIFTPGMGGLVDYWRDSSLGMVDISDSKVFGWNEVDLARAKANRGSGATRGTLINAAISAAQRDGMDPVTGFHSQIAVYIENWSVNGVPPGLDWSDPIWGMYWIEGSAEGRRVCLTPPHNGNICAHEMGHGFDMDHDLGPDLITHYQDPCCIMSQNNPFTSPRWSVDFGPAVCLPHLVQKGWMFSRRLYQDAGGWMTAHGGIGLLLSPLDDPSARANLGIKLAFRQGSKVWDYYLEYVKPQNWNRGLGGAFVFIRRFAPWGSGEVPAHLASIMVPAAGAKAEILEPAWQVNFTVERFDPAASVLRVTATKLWQWLRF